MSNKQIYHLVAIEKAKASQKKKHLSYYLDGQTIYFVFDQKIPLDLCLFKRNLSKMLLNNKENLEVDLDSFLNFVSPEQQKNFIYLIVSQIANVLSYVPTYKANQESLSCHYLCKNEYSATLKAAQVIAQGTNLAKQLQIMPTNFLTIKKYISFVEEKCKKINQNLSIEILDIDKIKQQKMELLQAVNKGSNEPCVMIVLKYLNGGDKQKTCGLIGKGILFDSGGYNLKPGDYQKTMNQDMSGSATVFGTIFALASNNVKANVIGFLPLTTNLVNSKSMVCHDVYYACDGQSVEILNTDAEGRLILADALAYATTKTKLDSVLTVATLTGLSSLCFGDVLTPFWSTNQKLIDQWNQTSQSSGDYLLNIPMLPQFDQWVDSSSYMADYANITKNKTCGNSTAAAFLNKFCHIPNYTHFDIAGTNELSGDPIVSLLLTLYLYVVRNYEEK